jgi:16S rRNA (uracil1498-N3)-methyltransferase
VTLPLFLVAPERLAGVRPGASVLLDGAEGRHAATVRRIGVGESVLLSDGRGTRATASVVAAGRAELELEVTAVDEDPEPDLRLVLVQALAKADRDDQAIESATELGVDEVVPWQAARSIVVWRGDRAAKALRKWESVVTAAAKQSRRSRVPVVAEPVSQRGLVERVRGSALALVLHEDASLPLAGRALPESGDVLVVVGPEGGISPDELAALEEAGAVAVRLGSTVLRSSSAGPAALAVLSAAAGRWT